MTFRSAAARRAKAFQSSRKEITRSAEAVFPCGSAELITRIDHSKPVSWKSGSKSPALKMDHASRLLWISPWPWSVSSPITIRRRLAQVAFGSPARPSVQPVGARAGSLEQDGHRPTLAGGHHDVEAAGVLAGVYKARDVFLGAGRAANPVKQAKLIPPNLDQILVVNPVVTGPNANEQRIAARRASFQHAGRTAPRGRCAAACNRDPLSGVIGAEEGPLIPMV